MRRILLLLLTFALSLKAAAAGIVPIAGAPLHDNGGASHRPAHVHAAAGARHVEHAHHAHDVAAAPDCCLAQDEQQPAHEHQCPHLAMATVLPETPAVETERVTAPPQPAALVEAASVVLEVPTPPPASLR
jgi:hypothetical protein